MGKLCDILFVFILRGKILVFPKANYSAAVSIFLVNNFELVWRHIDNKKENHLPTENHLAEF